MPRKQNSNASPKFSPDTRLDATGLVFIDVVLTERFLLPPEALRKIGEEVPTTVGDVSRLTGMPLEDVINVIDDCLTLGRDLWLDVADLSAESLNEGTVIVDMRPGVDMSSEPLHPSARLFHAQNPRQLMPYLRSLKKVLVLSHSEDHAWSAAMSLRQMGISAWIPRGTAIPSPTHRNGN